MNAGDDWAAVWAGVRALWPSDIPAGSTATQMAWQAVLGEELGYRPEEVGPVLRAMAIRLPKLPPLRDVVNELREQRARGQRAERPALPAPRSVVGGDLEAFVAAMRKDRARRKTEATDYARKGTLSPERLAKVHAEIDEVGPAEAVAYRVMRDGGEQDWQALLRAALDGGERYPSVDAFLAHESAPKAVDTADDHVVKRGPDAAIEPEPETWDVEAIAAEFVAHPELWPADRRAAMPAPVRQQVREVIAQRRAS